MTKRKHTLKEMERELQQSKSLEDWNEEYLNKNQYSYDWDELDSWISHMAKSLKTNWSQDLQSEYDRAIGWRGGMKRGWDNALGYYIDLIKQVQQEKEDNMNEEARIQQEQANKEDTPNYTQRDWTSFTKEQWFDKLDTYDGIAYGPMLNISWPNFNALIDDYCEDRKCKGKWLTNEWGTQSFIFTRKKAKKKTTKKK
tara:strand:- start:63 stop:656 length:594 start_codon:yes stop_codon:yes gene_type:complete